MTKAFIKVYGGVGCGKSALIGEIENLLKSNGISYEHADPERWECEKFLSGEDWQQQLKRINPHVVIDAEQVLEQKPFKFENSSNDFEALRSTLLNYLNSKFNQRGANEVSEKLRKYVSAATPEIIFELLAQRDALLCGVFNPILELDDHIRRVIYALDENDVPEGFSPNDVAHHKAALLLVRAKIDKMVSLQQHKIVSLTKAEIEETYNAATGKTLDKANLDMYAFAEAVQAQLADKLRIKLEQKA